MGGSYSSYSAHGGHAKYGPSYAGSRPASGLSHRKGPFRGPPPSFYRQGGYGKTGRTAPSPKHKDAYDHPSYSASSSSSASNSRYTQDDPEWFLGRNSVPHFDAKGHFRTQVAEDERRRARRSRNVDLDAEQRYLRNSGHDVMVGFFTICGMLVGGAVLMEVLPSLFLKKSVSSNVAPLSSAERKRAPND